MTALVGRLEGEGALRKAPHPEDGRKVVLHFNQEFAASNMHYFDDLVGSLRELCEQYTNDQLEVVASFMKEAARRRVGGDAAAGPTLDRRRRAGCLIGVACVGVLGLPVVLFRDAVVRRASSRSGSFVPT